jgi:outer membrane protein
MRRVLATAFVFAGSLWVSSVPASAQVKVGVINTQRALLDTAELQKAQAALEAKFKPRQEAMEKAQKELQGIQQNLQANAGKLTPQAEQELQIQGQRKQRELQRMTEDLQADVDRDRNDILAQAGEKMQAIVQKLAEEKGLDLVFDVSQALYFKPTLDITKDATAAYDKAHPAK